MDTRRALRNLRKRRQENIVQPIILGSTQDDEYLSIDDIPDTLSIEFRNDYDLEKLHRLILSKIYYQGVSVHLLKDKIRELTISLSKIRIHNESKMVRDEIANRKRDLETWSNSNRMSEYQQKAEILLSQYHSIPRPNQDLNIMTYQNITYVPNENDLARIEVIINFIKLASQYLKIDYLCTGYISQNDNICERCDFDLTDVMMSSDNSRICPKCGADNIGKDCSSNNNTGSSSNTSSGKHRGYEDISNFRKTYYRFMGKIRPRVDIEKLLVALDEYFARKGIPPGENIRDQPPTEDGRRHGTNISMMIDALKDTGYSNCYEDVNYIVKIYWGWELQDASHLEEIIMNDYRLTQAVWNEMSDTEKGRSSSISTQYRLFKHLQLRGYICCITDFKMPQTSSIQNYDNLWAIMCSRTPADSGIYFIPT